MRRARRCRSARRGAVVTKTFLADWLKLFLVLSLDEPDFRNLAAAAGAATFRIGTPLER